MRSRTITPILVAAWALAMVAGCHEPRDIVPVAPPGLEVSRMPAIPQGEGAQAIGEQPVETTKQNTVQNTVREDGPSSPPTPIGKPTTTATGLVYETLAEGTGATAKSGQTVTMHYTGTLADGSKFDSSRDRNEPFSTRIGTSQVIAGWDEGVPGMKVGERRKLTIPAKLGYRDQPKPKIPANSTLIFDVELLDVK